MPSPFMVLANTVTGLKNEMVDLKKEISQMRQDLTLRQPPKDHLVVEMTRNDVNVLMDQMVDVMR